MVEAKGELGVKDRDLLVGLDKLDNHLRAYRHPKTGEQIVTGVQSLVDIVKETNRALHGGDPAYYVIPETQRGVSDTLLLFENAGPDELRRLVTADLSKSHQAVRVRWMDATSYIPFIEHIEKGVEMFVPKSTTVSPTGGIYSIVSVVGTLIYDLMRSFAVALVAVTLMMIALLKSLRLGLVAMVPNLVPIGMVLGFMGFTGIPLDLANLLIASIVIGVAVDATIHYLFQFQVHHQAGETVESSIQHTLDHAGRAIVSTSIILTLGFSAYLWSSMANIQRFGLLVGTACICALFTNLILVPAFLRGMYAEEEDDETTQAA
jgi:predicted RND superfamily exporter protein